MITWRLRAATTRALSGDVVEIGFGAGLNLESLSRRRAFRARGGSGQDSAAIWRPNASRRTHADVIFTGSRR